MVEQKIIQEKYFDLRKQFENKQIDDYETFIRSRLIEYLINVHNENLDSAFALVDSIIDSE